MQNKKDTIFVAIVVLFVIIVVFIWVKIDATYKTKCRESGGVPVKGYYSLNCAKEGFIDINK